MILLIVLVFFRGKALLHTTDLPSAKSLFGESTLHPFCKGNNFSVIP